MSNILMFNRGASEVTTESKLMLNIFSFHEFCNYKTAEITTKKELLDSLIGEEDTVQEKKKHGKKKLKKKKKLKTSTPDNTTTDNSTPDSGHSYYDKSKELGKPFDYY